VVGSTKDLKPANLTFESCILKIPMMPRGEPYYASTPSIDARLNRLKS
jgi:hypothetical protein